MVALSLCLDLSGFTWSWPQALQPSQLEHGGILEFIAIRDTETSPQSSN